MTGETIVIVRGDSYGKTIQRKDKNGQPILVEAPKMYFTVKTSDEIKDIVFQKTKDDMTFDENGVYHFTIDPEDTDGLAYGDYVYDAEVVIPADNYKKTLCKGIFRITSEVTHKENEV